MPGLADAELRVTSAIADLARLYPWLDHAAAEAGLSSAMLNGMQVALEEAAANVATHAYPTDAPGPITVRLTRLPNGASLTVEDEGPPFDPTATTPRARAASILDAEPGGHGLTLIRHYCRSVSYERDGRRNRLTMSFALLAD
ncbi:MAG: ATP-binding protein [Proteobacteria bacterium]|nr:ATP-binding protein [Pseudomonadota bacterium]